MQQMLTETEKLEIIEHEWAKARAKNPEVVMRVNVQDETDESGKPRINVVIAFSGTWASAASITRAGIWREVLEFVRLPLPLLRVRRGRFFDRNIWPDSCVFRIQRQPFLKPGFAISLDSIDGAFRFANATVDAFVRMNDKHVLALVEAVHGAHLAQSMVLQRMQLSLTT